MDPKDQTPSQPEKSETTAAPTGTPSMIRHPNNPLFKFPTPETVKACVDRLVELAKTHIPTDKLDKLEDVTEEDITPCSADSGDCELCWLLKQATDSDPFLDYVKKHAIGLFGPLALMVPPRALFSFAFFFMLLGLFSERTDRADNEIADLEKLLRN